MSIRITYPNEGVYAGGRPRLERVDDATGEIKSCREATDAEALQWMALEQLQNISFILNEIHYRRINQ